MSNLVNITGEKLIRDINNMAVMNNDSQELEQYNLKRKIFAAQKNEINNIKQQVSSIENEISQIKNLLMEILKNGN